MSAGSTWNFGTVCKPNRRKGEGAAGGVPGLTISCGYEAGGGDEGVSGGGFGEDMQGGEGFADEALGLGAGVGDGVAGGDELPDVGDAVGVGAVEEFQEQLAMGGRRFGGNG